MAGDWIKVHRSILESSVFNDPFTLKLWIWCLCKAAFTDMKVAGFEIKRGDFITGRIRGSDEMQCSPSKWDRGMKRLHDLNCIILKPNSKFTYVTICNYETYQNGDLKSEQQVNSDRTASEQQVNSDRTHNKNTKNDNNSKNVSDSGVPESPEPAVVAVYDRFVAMFESKKMPVPLELTDDRRKKIATRLKNKNWLNWMRKVPDKLPLKGSWQPTIDWFIKNNTNVVKLVEDTYRSWGVNGKKQDQTVEEVYGNLADNIAKQRGTANANT